MSKELKRFSDYDSTSMEEIDYLFGLKNNETVLSNSSNIKVNKRFNNALFVQNPKDHNKMVTNNLIEPFLGESSVIFHVTYEPFDIDNNSLGIKTLKAFFDKSALSYVGELSVKNNDVVANSLFGEASYSTIEKIGTDHVYITHLGFDSGSMSVGMNYIYNGTINNDMTILRLDKSLLKEDNQPQEYEGEFPSYVYYTNEEILQYGHTYDLYINGELVANSEAVELGYGNGLAFEFIDKNNIEREVLISEGLEIEVNGQPDFWRAPNTCILVPKELIDDNEEFELVIKHPCDQSVLTLNMNDFVAQQRICTDIDGYGDAIVYPGYCLNAPMAHSLITLDKAIPDDYYYFNVDLIQYGEYDIYIDGEKVAENIETNWSNYGTSLEIGCDDFLLNISLGYMVAVTDDYITSTGEDPNTYDLSYANISWSGDEAIKYYHGEDFTGLNLAASFVPNPDSQKDFTSSVIKIVPAGQPIEPGFFGTIYPDIKIHNFHYEKISPGMPFFNSSGDGNENPSMPD